MTEKYIKMTEKEREKLSRTIEEKFGAESRVTNGAMIAMLCEQELQA